MRIWRTAGTVLVTLGCAMIGIMAWDAWIRAHMYYPTQENESPFLRAYELKSVVRPFMSPDEGSGEVRGSGGGAGTQSATHHAGFSEQIVMRTDQKQFLVLAVRDDVLQRLVGARARIVSQYGTSDSGFHFEYRMPNSTGSVFIRPVWPGNVHRNWPLKSGLEDVEVQVEINEEWFPNGVPLTRSAVARE